MKAYKESAKPYVHSDTCYGERFPEEKLPVVRFYDDSGRKERQLKATRRARDRRAEKNARNNKNFLTVYNTIPYW